MTVKLNGLLAGAATIALCACGGAEPVSSEPAKIVVETTEPAVEETAVALSEPSAGAEAAGIEEVAIVEDTVETVVTEVIETEAEVTEQTDTSWVKEDLPVAPAPVRGAVTPVSSQSEPEAPAANAAEDVVEAAPVVLEAEEPDIIQAAQDLEPMPAPDANAVYADILETYISEKDGINFFAYGDVTEEDHARLKSYISGLETAGIDGLSEDEEMAFWFNLYNAKTIDVILDNYPLKSIRSLGLFNRGPWDRKVVDVAGFGEMSLNNIEHDTLRAEWDEPRIHYAVNCASYGCPNLALKPWTAETLEEDLEAAAYAYINHPRGMRAEGGRIIASSIFDWYKGDFGGNDAGVIEHALQYAQGDLAEALRGAKRISKFEYDWSLNED